jgi:hypothetical protein
MMIMKVESIKMEAYNDLGLIIFLLNLSNSSTQTKTIKP